MRATNGHRWLYARLTGEDRRWIAARIGGGFPVTQVSPLTVASLGPLALAELRRRVETQEEWAL